MWFLYVTWWAWLDCGWRRNLGDGFLLRSLGGASLTTHSDCLSSICCRQRARDKQVHLVVALSSGGELVKADHFVLYPEIGILLPSDQPKWTRKNRLAKKKLEKISIYFVF